jgi:CheY-like chemotaxis protein
VAVAVVSEGSRVRFDVRDTGIGIPVEHVDRVFDAFHQVDGGVARKHGGTGLGLAISRDLATLLGGTLTLKSSVGQGTVFSLLIPVNAPAAAPPPAPSNLRATGMQRVQAPAPVARTRKATGRQTIVSGGTSDDRDKLDRQKRTLLVIEDDATFAQLLVDLGRELGFQALSAPTADEGVALALEHHPDGILLDVNLPDHSGLTVLERIKRQPLIRHIPVHMISGTDHAQRALELGAIGYLMKPANRDSLVQAIKRIEERTSQTVRRLLIVEDDAVQADALTHLLGGADIEITSTDKVSEALTHLSKTTFDCVVMDLRLTDGTGFELLEKMTADERITFPPVIVHTGKDLSDEEESKLRGYSSSIIVKGARSPERLLDEVALFLHQVEAEMPPDRQRILREVRSRESIFEGKRVLVVEDDVRNVFALTSILEPRGLSVTIARNGREALEQLDKGAVDLVLMDIMMPEMDGLEATKRIRQRKDGMERLPIIALTAKAMADDRQACLDAGANDYLAKPIDIDMLLSLLRVWMPR